MITRKKKRKSAGSKKAIPGQADWPDSGASPSRGTTALRRRAVDFAKRRSQWMLCDFFGKVLIEQTTVEHTTGSFSGLTLQFS